MGFARLERANILDGLGSCTFQAGVFASLGNRHTKTEIVIISSKAAHSAHYFTYTKYKTLRYHKCIMYYIPHFRTTHILKFRLVHQEPLFKESSSLMWVSSLSTFECFEEH